MECQSVISKVIENLRESFKCSRSGNRLSIITPYLYPDNDLIEVYLEEVGPNIVRVTDLGETLRHLESIGLDVYASSKRQFLLEQISRRLNVNTQRGKLEKEGTAQEVGNLLMDVVATAQSIADLAYTSKAYEPATFPKEVSIFLHENQIEHEYQPYVFGASRKKYRVSVRLDGSRESEILVEAMSPNEQFAMTPVVNRVIRMWVDINDPKKRKKISLLNDVDFVWRAEDLALLERWSLIHRWSKKEDFLNKIRV